jgi:DNA-binding transcriptional LysR family regulator
MEIQQIRYFLELAKELHFWHTAEKIFITQSSLSRHIKALEVELGFELFERTKRSVKLTAAGIFMQKEWTKILIQIDNIHVAARQIHDGEVGELRVGHPGSITHSVLPDLMAAITQKFPKLRLELTELMTIDMEKALLNFQVDIGFRREISTNNLLETRTMFAENFAIVLPQNHVIKAEVLDNISVLSNEFFIIPNLETGSRYTQILRTIFKDADFEPKVNMVSEFGTTIISLVARGLGVSILPISYSKNAPNNVRFIPIPYSSYLYVQWRKDDNSPILRHFVDVIEKNQNTMNQNII